MDSPPLTPPVPVPRRPRTKLPTEASNPDIRPEKDEPLQLIEFARKTNDDNTTIKLIDETLETIIKKCKNLPMSIICICGPARKGKSFILGYMLRYLEAMERDESDWMDWSNPKKPLEGFKFRNGTAPETQGIWIWSRPFFIERDDGTQMAVLLMDTQGTFDAFTTNKDMSAIVGLSLLTSSVMIFNCFTDLQEDILTSLNTYTAYGQLALGNIRDPPFQKLIFLIRDWNNPSEYAYGKRGGKKFLTNALKILPEHALEAKETRENIKSCFAETDCFLMPHIGEKALLAKFTGAISELSKDFAKRLEEFINHLINVDTLTTKQFLGNEVTAKELKTYLDSYIQIFNSNELPSPMSMWEATAEAHNKGTIEKAVEEFKKLVANSTKNNAHLSNVDMDRMLSEARKRTLEIFGKMKKIGTQNQISKCEDGLLAQLKKEKEKRQTDNETLRAKYIDAAVKSAKLKIQEMLASSFPTHSDGTFEFYEESKIVKVFKELKEQILQELRVTLQHEEPNSVNDVRKSLETYADKELDLFMNKNAAQQAYAEETMTALVKRLVNQYKEEMEKTTNEHQLASLEFLKSAHGQIKASVEDLFFKCKKPGKLEFHQTYFEVLQRKVDKFYGHVEDKHRLALQDTSQTAESNINTALEYFKDELKTRTVNIQSKDEFMTINDQLIKEVLVRFHENGNPYPENHVLSVKTFDLLKDKLHALSNEVQSNLSQRLDLEQQKIYLACVGHLDTAVLLYENSMVENIKLDDEDEFRKKHEKAQDLAWKKYCDLAHKSNHRNPNELKSAFEEKINMKWESVKSKHQLTQANIQLLVKESHSQYEALMKEEIEKITTTEDLQQLHSRAKSKAIKNFKEMCPQNIPVSKTANHEIQLEKEIDDTFEELKVFFDLQEEKNEANLKSLVSDCRKYYQEEMETHLTNTRYIQPDELSQAHTQTKQSVISKLAALAATLSDSQKVNLETEMDILFEKYKEKNDMILNTTDFVAPAIGIDLGTTNCCVAVYYQGDVQVIPNFAYQNKTTTASYVQFDENGVKSTGNFAKDNVYKDPENTIFDAKRIIGRKFEDPVLQQDMKVWPFTVVKDEGIPKISVNGKLYYPEQISSSLLFELTRMVEKYLKLERGTITKAVITVPAYFNDGQRNATIDAGQIAGLEVLTILNEPTAAAIAYSLGTTHHKGRKILVFDMGGGTFDVSVVDVTPGNIDVLAVDGDTHLGGEDFDNRLVQHCLQEFFTKHKIDLRGERNGPNRDDVLRRLSRLKQECEKAKIMLTSGIQATIFLDNIYTTKDGRGIDLEVVVTRSTFEKINKADFQQAIDITADAIKAAGLKKEQIDDVVLVGGSTRIPKIQEMLSTYFNNKALTYSINPDTAVAYGAAIQAAKLNGDLVKKEFSAVHQDVTPYSIGTDVKKFGNLLLSVIIKKNTRIPCKRVEQYITTFDNQTSMSIQILQGENPVAKNNELLGEFDLDGIPPAKKGEEKVNVTMEIDTMGCLHVTAFCLSTQGKKSMKITEHKLRMRAEDKQRLINEVGELEKNGQIS